MSGAPTLSKERLVWADLAKGICMLLVVLQHVHYKHYMHLDWTISLPVRGAWDLLHYTLAPLRMPLFFVISGTFAAAALRRPWRQVGMQRVASPYYLYVLWLCISAAIYASLQSDIDYLLVGSLWGLARRLVVPDSTLWYVYALALYFLVGKALIRAPAWLVLPGAGLLSAAATGGWSPLFGLSGMVLRNFVFFLAGAYMPSLVKRAAGQTTPRRLAVAGAAYGGVIVTYLLGAHDLFGVPVLAGVVAVWFGVAAASLLARVRLVSSPGSYIGRNTLPIFIMHVPLIALIRWLSESSGAPLWDHFLHNDAVAAVYPVVLSVALIATCLLLHRLLLLGRAGWLFRLPGPTGRRQPAALAATAAAGPPATDAPGPAR